MLTGGGYAQFAVADESCTLRIPKAFSMIEAAAIPENYFTVWSNVFNLGNLKAGETFLVHGGSSGIGTTAIQLSKSLGAKVIATTGSEEKSKVCSDLGADIVINYNKHNDWDSIVRYATSSNRDRMREKKCKTYFNSSIYNIYNLDLKF